MRTTVSLLGALAILCTDPVQPTSCRPLAQTAASPGREFDIAAPADVGLRTADLTSLVETARRDARKDLRSLLVARRGRLVLEEYFNDTDRETLQDVRSAAKSITGTLIGIALHEKRIASLDASLVSFFPAQTANDARADRDRVTVRHLLQMRSGFDADDWNDDPNSPGTESRMERAADRLIFGLQVPMAARPGERWQYSSVNTMLLGRIVSVTTGRDLAAYADEKLFTPLGFTRWEWRRDGQGQVVPQGNLSLRARDLLKFGLLFQQRGRWRGRQLVPETWIEEATVSRSALPTDAATGLGTLYKGYGYQWWTGATTTARGTRSYYFASGNGGQRVFVVPTLDLVVVVTSSAYNRGYAHRRAHMMFERVLAAVATD